MFRHASLKTATAWMSCRLVSVSDTFVMPRELLLQQAGREELEGTFQCLAPVYATWHGLHLRELGSDSCKDFALFDRRKFGLCHKDASFLYRKAGTSFLMEVRASHSRPQAKHNGSLGRRVDPNNLSRAECKVLIEAVCCRSQEKGRNILTEMWERYDRHVMNCQPMPPLHQPRLISSGRGLIFLFNCATGQDCSDPPWRSGLKTSL